MSHRRTILGLASMALGGVALTPRATAVAAPADDRALLAELRDEREVRHLFAGYVRAVMRRDGDAVAAFFAPDAWIRNFTNVMGEAVPGVAPLRAAEIGAFVSNAYHPYHPGMWSHILHADGVMRLDGARGHYSAQVVYISTFARGPDGAPLVRPDLLGDKHAGEVTPTNCAFWEADVVRLAGAWKIAELRIIVDLPYVASA